MKKRSANTNQQPKPEADDLGLGDLAAQLNDMASDLDAAPTIIEAEADDPLENVKYTGDIREDAKAELTAMQKAFRARANREVAVQGDSNDSETWFCVYFPSRDLKDKFLAHMDWAKHADKYIDGEKLAKQQGLELPPVKLIPFRGGRGKVGKHPRIR